jgi:hypothetical protein
VEANGAQTVVVRLPSHLVRDIGQKVETNGSYESISEFVALAVANQLALEGNEDGLPNPQGGASIGPEHGWLLFGRPPSDAPWFAEPRDIAFAPLFVLTNRLFPVKLACRVLANLQAAHQPVPIALFHREAVANARQLGLRLRSEDERERRRGGDRRWVALPVGPDEHAAGSRFAQFFTLGISGSGDPTGLLPQLSLAYPSADHTCGLTELGWELAAAPNPVLGETGEPATLGQEERACLMKAVRSNPPELRSVAEFVDVVDAVAGSQAEVDAALQRAHSDWRQERATAHRAAMLGRLRDIGLVELDGRGPAGRIRLDSALKNLIVNEEET